MYMYVLLTELFSLVDCISSDEFFLPVLTDCNGVQDGLHLLLQLTNYTRTHTEMSSHNTILLSLHYKPSGLPNIFLLGER